MSWASQVEGSVGVHGTFEFRDADGNVIKTVDLVATVPLSSLGLTDEQAAALSEGEANGSDDR